MSTAVLTTTELKRPSRPRRISVASVREALRAVAAEHPGRACGCRPAGVTVRYVRRGAPNSLVALVLARLGFSTGVLTALDQEHPVGEVVERGVTVAESRHPALAKLDPLARQLLAYVQDRQDAGRPWDRIVAEALRPALFLRARRKPWLSAS